MAWLTKEGKKEQADSDVDVSNLSSIEESKFEPEKDWTFDHYLILDL
jgi:hypothetical protein